MSQVLALAVSLGLLGAVATFVFAKLELVLWAGFIAWAAFYHCGGDRAAATTTVVGGIFGAFCAWVGALLIAGIPVSDSMILLRGALAVGVTVFALTLASRFKPVSVVPVSVYGYAATVAYLWQTAGSFSLDRLTHLGRTNGLIIIALSIILGTLFGLASAKLAGALKKS